jgi:radical SAM superfamily enzyme YgiQ (UPF0313 family)
MEYVGNVIRPPSEADALVLQVTVGCSYNKCTFCGAYKDITFAIKDEAAIERDLQFARSYCRSHRRVFLADGDVLILSQKRLVQLFRRLRQHLPWIKRISLYGNARAIRSKSPENLRELKALGLDRVYMGLESGCDQVLRAVKKGETAATMVAAAKKIKDSGIFLSVTALLGLGGLARSEAHAEETAKVLSLMAPHQIAILTWIPLANTALADEVRSGRLPLPSPHQTLAELAHLVAAISGVRCQFHANHASSYLPLSGRLPRDREALLQTIEQAQSGEIPLVAECRRAL